MKFPKIDLACSYDDFRPTLNLVKIEKELTFASDDHIIVRHRTNELFKDDFIEEIPVEGLLIPARAIMLLRQKSTLSVRISDDKRHLELNQKDGSVITYPFTNDINYPDANSLFPKKEDCKPLSEIGIHTKLLDRLASAMGCDTHILHLYFYKATKAIYCTTQMSDNFGVDGLIMPCMVNL